MKKDSVKKISQRCEYFEDWGMACGPCGISGICAETAFRENGEDYFYVLVCISEGCETHISKGKSCFDYYTMASDDEDFEELEGYKGSAPIDKYYNEMAKLCLAKMKEEDYDEENIEEFKEQLFEE